MIEWHCVLTKPQQEARASDELQNQGFTVYLALIDSSKPKSPPLFPRYIFAQFDRDTDNWGLIRSTRGCCDVLRDGFRPAIVRQPIMDAIMAYAPSERPTPAIPAFTEGQTVQITTGLLRGYTALFMGSSKNRTIALLELMGKPWKVPLADIAAIA